MKKKPKHIDVATTLYNRIAGQSLERVKLYWRLGFIVQLNDVVVPRAWWARG